MSAEGQPDVAELLRQRAAMVQDFLNFTYIDQVIPGRLAEAVRYSLLAEAKRVRPVLCLSAAMACAEADPKPSFPSEKLFFQSIMPFVAGIEMIHTYSLIHDDLPAMDNDDLRRGRPTNHKAFDEATAILAGDALLSDAFAFMAACPIDPALLVPAIAVMAEMAGAKGMVGGQILDMAAEGKKISMEQLLDLNSRKTGALLRGSCHCGAILAGANSLRQSALRLYGENLGIAFQIIDDILDLTGDETRMGKKTGSDAARAKSTWVSLLGVEGARSMAADYCAKAVAAIPIELFPGHNSEFLRQFTHFMLNRTH